MVAINFYTAGAYIDVIMKPSELIRINIDRILKQKRWRRSDLARALGTSDSHVSQIMSGARWGQRMEWVTYEKVCKALGVDELELLKLPCQNSEIREKLELACSKLTRKDDVHLILLLMLVLEHQDSINADGLQIIKSTLNFLKKELGKNINDNLVQFPTPAANDA